MQFPQKKRSWERLANRIVKKQRYVLAANETEETTARSAALLERIALLGRRRTHVCGNHAEEV
jgi:hypothetical protein